MANKNIISVEWKSTESGYCYHWVASKKWFLDNKNKSIKKFDPKLRKHSLFMLQKQGK
jgi:ribosomal protein L33